MVQEANIGCVAVVETCDNCHSKTRFLSCRSPQEVSQTVNKNLQWEVDISLIRIHGCLNKFKEKKCLPAGEA